MMIDNFRLTDFRVAPTVSDRFSTWRPVTCYVFDAAPWRNNKYDRHRRERDSRLFVREQDTIIIKRSSINQIIKPTFTSVFR
jgi:hypothetical protein